MGSFGGPGSFHLWLCLYVRPHVRTTLVTPAPHSLLPALPTQPPAQAERRHQLRLRTGTRRAMPQTVPSPPTPCRQTPSVVPCSGGKAGFLGLEIGVQKTNYLDLKNTWVAILCTILGSLQEDTNVGVFLVLVCLVLLLATFA